MIEIFSRPLFIGAHCDDVELFAGGTLARFAESASVLVFSHHSGGLGEYSPDVELDESMKILGVNPRRVYSLRFDACTGVFEIQREKIAGNMRFVLENENPDVVITHQSSDTNQDHRLIYREVLRVFKSKCSILCGCFPNNDLPAAPRSLFVKLKWDNIDDKMRALDCYKSQQKMQRLYLKGKNLITQAEFWGSMINEKYAEAFEVVRLVV